MATTIFRPGFIPKELTLPEIQQAFRSILRVANTQDEELSSEKIRIDVTQTAHGLSVQDAVYYDESTGTWKLAQADALGTLGIGIVSEASDPDEFAVILAGEIVGLTGLTAGHYYFVSESTAGLITTTEGAVYSNPILQATSSTEAIVLPFRAQDLGGATTKSTRSDYDSTSPEYLYTGSAEVGSLTSEATWRITRYDFSSGTITKADGNDNFDNIYDNRESLAYS